MDSHAGLQAQDIIVISGLPGTGKTLYTEWLQEEGWGCLRSDDYETMSNSEQRAFGKFAHGDDGALLAIASGHVSGFVVEWGFPVTMLNLVEGVVKRGFNAWYFEGERDAARESWVRRQVSEDASPWFKQADDLLANEARIRDIYGARILRTVESGPSYPLSPPQMHEVILGGRR